MEYKKEEQSKALIPKTLKRSASANNKDDGKNDTLAHSLRAPVAVAEHGEVYQVKGKSE